MKCDKLEKWYAGQCSPSCIVYGANEVDATIADLKAEADKAIAELEMKLAKAQLVLRLNKPEALYSNLETMSRLSHEIDVVARRERHQKYKRCLAMARWCRSRSCFYDTMREDSLFWAWKSDRAYKWHKRWLELAEKFKEAK